MPEQAIAQVHNCFDPPLPTLPYGYRFDLQRPLKLVPFVAFEGHLPEKDICRRCYINALTLYDLEMVNSHAARATMSDPASIALAGLDRHVTHVNTVSHPMFNDIYPIVPREGRTLVYIGRHYARRGTATRLPTLTYMIKYRILDGPHLSALIPVTEFDLRKYKGAGTLIVNYWYGEQSHNINATFIRSIVTRLTPFANTAIWNKLPHEEAMVLHWLWKKGKLGV